MPGFDHVTLRTDRLVLHPIDKADATTLAAIFGDAVVMRYWSMPAWTKDAQARAFITRDLMAMRSGEYIRLGLERTSKRG